MTTKEVSTPDRPTPLTDALVLPIQGWTDLYDAAEAYNKLLKHARQLERQSAELREALEVIPPDRLEILAEWLDNQDKKFPAGRGNEVQNDLWRMAIKARAALARKQP